MLTAPTDGASHSKAQAKCLPPGEPTEKFGVAFRWCLHGDLHWRAIIAPMHASEQMGRPSRVFADYGRESLAALGTVAAARRRPSARCARLVELPTPWFVGRHGFGWPCGFNKLSGPPSPNFSPRPAKSRQERFRPYADRQHFWWIRVATEAKLATHLALADSRAHAIEGGYPT